MLVFQGRDSRSVTNFFHVTASLSFVICVQKHAPNSLEMITSYLLLVPQLSDEKSRLIHGIGSNRDLFFGFGFVLQMDHDIVLLFSKYYENVCINLFCAIH